MGKISLNSSLEVPEDFEIPDHVTMWYDKHLKLWTLQTLDKYDNQIGKAEYIKGKQNALRVKQELENSI
jgi:hypothetical protein